MNNDTIVIGQLSASVVVAKIGSAMFDLAAHPGAILRLGLSVKHLAGAFEMTGADQQRGLGKLLQAVENAREEARLNRSCESMPIKAEEDDV